jgi:hypothetical protein
VVAVGETDAVPAAAPAVSKPAPVQLVALTLLQVSSLLPPIAMTSGSALSRAVTGPPTVTVASAGLLAAPPAPVHVSEYVVSTFGETDTLPSVAPAVKNPVPVQVVALALDQLSVLEPPSAMAVGSADSAAVTAEPTVTVVLAGRLIAPPAPVHVTAYVVVVVGDTGTVPVTLPPVEKPMPVQLVALVPFQVRSLEPPGAMSGGSADSVTETAGPTATVAVISSVAAPAPVQVST